MNTRIFNGTPHDIKIVKGAVFNPSIRKWVGGEVVMTIKSNGMLNAKIDVEELPPLEKRTYEYDSPEIYPSHEDWGRCYTDEIPLFGKKIVGCDPLPNGYDIYIVSALYSSAILKTGADVSRCYTVADPVMTEDGNTFLGCRGLAPLF